MGSELDLPTPNRELIRRLRRQWGYQKAGEILQQLLQAQLEEYWFNHSDHMFSRAEQMTIARGNRIATQLETANPITSRGLQRVWDLWLMELETRLHRP